MSDRSHRNIARVDFNVLHNSGCKVKKTIDSDSELETLSSSFKKIWKALINLNLQKRRYWKKLRIAYF